MRGKAEEPPEQTVATRITPACAGKSLNARFPAVTLKDHPRVCGEKNERITKQTKNAGSPPRVRGKAVQLIKP